MLDLKQLKDMPPGTIFATGIVENAPGGIFMTRDGGQLRWIAVRGEAPDWTIYCHWDYKPIEWIRNYGDKVNDKDTIKMLVPCDDEAYKIYRH